MNTDDRQSEKKASPLSKGKHVGGSNVQPCEELKDSSSSYLPCDAIRLFIKGQEEENETDAPSVECTEPVERDKTLSEEQKKLLGSDDLLLQITADYLVEGINKEGNAQSLDELKKAEISSNGKISPSCPKNLHKEIIFVEPDGKTHRFPVNVLHSPIKLLAPRITHDSIFSGLEAYWIFNKNSNPSSIARIKLDSCGVRDGQEPNKILEGRVEIIRKDTIELAIKIPPFMKKTYSKEKTLSGNKEKSATSQGFGQDRFIHEKENSVEYNQQGGTNKITSTEIKGSGRRVYGIKTTSESTVSQQKISVINHGHGLVTQKNTDALSKKDKPLEEYDINPTFSLKRNGKECDVTKIIENLLNTILNIKKSIDDLIDLIPKAGLFVEIELSVLEGEIVGSWGVEPSEKAEHPRIWLVQKYIDLTFNVKVFDFKATVNFGIKMEIEFLFKIINIEALVFTEFSVSSKISASFKQKPIKLEFPHFEPVKGEGAASIKGGVKGQAKLIGIGYEAEASITIEAKAETSLTISRSDPFKFSAEIKIPAIVAMVKYSGPFIKSGHHEVKCPENGDDLYKKSYTYPKTS